jgi:hypothetical protein
MTNYYWARLLVGLMVAALSLACSAILDTDNLNTQPVEDDASPTDGKQEKDKYIEKDILPGDLGSCKAGKACTVSGQKGLCAVGTSVCYEAGTGTCKQTVKPTTETCDGKDSDCDGLSDKTDGQAHAWCKSTTSNRADLCGGASCKCGEGNICATGHTCVSGTCKCGTGPKCTLGHTCVNGTCKCGTGPKCEQPNPRCTSGKCGCGSNTCTASQTCDTKTNTCKDKPPDAGPDLGPKLDKGPKPDLPVPDKGPTPDAPTVTPDTKPTPDAPITTPDTGADDTGTDSAQEDTQP